ncbi:uncharacterized protein PHACADRAFT_260942 [Phanerochaete carnosa HHB-10118-sp]|uniref:Uncharacterized protein n=1 Tax=Phanerochaete carnosa (strain HHB-10118-sp) TaxID=650164 RepID=K5W0U1_PHACS|nr:uncharacterized protein PHACADRAFT_260942 [Phanerochaete carnosa HHB-10118-sp]EKM52494.1 hypothetical protein PHACADRAFT_260942 [Phanerochaete carnosa HHB-10118-sp]
MEVLIITGAVVCIFATGNLLFRVAAIWKANRIVVMFLILIGIGHWAVVLAVMAPPIIRGHGNLNEEFDISKNIKINVSMPFFFYTFLADLLIVIMTVTGLTKQHAARSSPLWKMLYRQGIMYFLVAFILQIPNIIFQLYTKSACLFGAFGTPGLIVGAMASCSVVSSLLTPLRITEPGSRSAVCEKVSIDISQPAPGSHLLTTNINLPIGVESSEASSTVIASLPEVCILDERDLEIARALVGAKV